MLVFRLSRKKYAGELTEKGAALSGNRWNSKAVQMICCADSRALAMAEVVVHLPFFCFLKIL
jgi:RES domain-containing protein